MGLMTKIGKDLFYFNFFNIIQTIKGRNMAVIAFKRAYMKLDTRIAIRYVEIASKVYTNP